MAVSIVLSMHSPLHFLRVNYYTEFINLYEEKHYRLHYSDGTDNVRRQPKYSSDRCTIGFLSRPAVNHISKGGYYK